MARKRRNYMLIAFIVAFSSIWAQHLPSRKSQTLDSSVFDNSFLHQGQHVRHAVSARQISHHDIRRNNNAVSNRPAEASRHAFVAMRQPVAAPRSLVPFHAEPRKTSGNMQHKIPHAHLKKTTALPDHHRTTSVAIQPLSSRRTAHMRRNTTTTSIPKVDDIEAAVLKAVETSATSPLPRRHLSRHRPLEVDNIEEAVLRAVLAESNAASFPAFATRRRIISKARIPITSTPLPSNITTSQHTIADSAASDEKSNEKSGEKSTISSTTTSTEAEIDSADQIRQIEDDIIAALNSVTEPTTESTTSTTLASTSSTTTKSTTTTTISTTTTVVPPAEIPPQQPSASPGQNGPPGSLPPSDKIVNELNDANDFMQVALRLNLIKRLIQ